MSAAKPEAAGFDPFRAACSSAGLGNSPSPPTAKEGLRQSSSCAMFPGALRDSFMDGREQYHNSTMRCPTGVVTRHRFISLSENAGVPSSSLLQCH